ESSRLSKIPGHKVFLPWQTPRQPLFQGENTVSIIHHPPQIFSFSVFRKTIQNPIFATGPVLQVPLRTPPVLSPRPGLWVWIFPEDLPRTASPWKVFQPSFPPTQNQHTYCIPANWHVHFLAAGCP